MMEQISGLGQWIGYLLGLVAIGIMLLAAYKLDPSPALSLLLFVAGGLLGWVVGILMTPTTEMEKHWFPEYGKALSTFITGYLVAKIDKAFQPSALQDVTFIVRLLIVGSAFLLGTLFTYIWRVH